MPNIGFGLDNNETAQSTGFDKYKLSLSQTLGVTAEDTWHFNPLYSIYRYGNLLETRADGPPMGGTDEFNAQAYQSTEQEPLIPDVSEPIVWSNMLLTEFWLSIAQYDATPILPDNISPYDIKHAKNASLKNYLL
jgi:hypothetical protein